MPTNQFTDNVIIPIELLKDFNGETIIDKSKKAQHDKIKYMVIEDISYNIKNENNQFIESIVIPILKIDASMQLVDASGEPIYETITINIKDASDQFIETISIPKKEELNQIDNIKYMVIEDICYNIKDENNQFIESIMIRDASMQVVDSSGEPIIINNVLGLDTFSIPKQEDGIIQYVNVPVTFTDLNGLSVINKIIQYVDVPVTLTDLHSETIYIKNSYDNIIYNDLTTQSKEITIELEDALGNPLVDENGQIQICVFNIEVVIIKNINYEYAYNIRYINPQAETITKEEYDISGGYIGAYVGCTYHCG
jgi:hypothetical protein